MIRLLYPATRECPAEYTYTEPVACAECNAEWDYDAHHGFEFIEEDGAIYCNGQCHDRWRAQQHRAAVRDLVVPHLNAATEAAFALAKEHGHDPALGGATSVCEEAAAALRRYADTGDSGQRHGLMLDYGEALSLQALLMRLEYTLQVNAGICGSLVAHGPRTEADHVEALRSLVRLARVRRVLENAAARTEGKPEPWSDFTKDRRHEF